MTDEKGREIDAWWPSDFLERYGDDLESAADVAEQHADRFVAALVAVPEDALHTRRDPARWSPAEVADHVVLAGTLFAEALERALRDGAPPEMPRGRVGPDGRPLSPPGGEPRTGRERSALIADLQSVHARVAAAARDLAERGANDGVVRLRQAFLGPLDALGVARLAAWHVRHHRRQLERG